MKALKQYSKYLKKHLAYGEILKALKDECLRELKKQPEGVVIVDGVEYHLTKKVEKSYPAIEDELKRLRDEIQRMKDKEEQKGTALIKEKEIFDSYIPKSSKDDIFKEVTDYRKFFGV